MLFNFFSYPIENKEIPVENPKCYMAIYDSSGTHLPEVPIEEYLSGNKNDFMSEILKISMKSFPRWYLVFEKKEKVIDALWGLTQGCKSAYVLSLNCNQEDLLKAVGNKEFHTCIIMAENHYDMVKNKNYPNHKIETFENTPKKDDLKEDSDYNACNIC